MVLPGDLTASSPSRRRRTSRRGSSAPACEGVFFYPAGSGAARDAIVLGPPFILGDAEIDAIATVLPRAIDAAVARLEGGATGFRS